jgi:hypothetical protein
MAAMEKALVTYAIAYIEPEPTLTVILREQTLAYFYKYE